MSEEELSHTDEGLDATKLDASMTIDSASLSSEERDFARQMGFGEDEKDGEDEDSTRQLAAEAPTPGQGAARNGSCPTQRSRRLNCDE
jgi:hypothetical protein